MPSLYGKTSDNTNRKAKKIWCNPSGTNQKIKRIWASVGGVNRKIFSGAVEWTYSARLINDPVYYLSSYGNSDTLSAFVSINGDGGSGYFVRMGVLYTFNEPLTLPVGTQFRHTFGRKYSHSTTINFDLYDGSNNYLFGNQLPSDSDNEGSKIFTLNSDLTISALDARISTNFSPEKNQFYSIWQITLPGEDPFILNNSGTSENK